MGLTEGEQRREPKTALKGGRVTVHMNCIFGAAIPRSRRFESSSTFAYIH